MVCVMRCCHFILLKLYLRINFFFWTLKFTFFKGVILCYSKFYKWLWTVLYCMAPISYNSVSKPHSVWDFSSYHLYGKMVFSFLIDNSILCWELWKRQSYKLALINQEEQQETECTLKCQCIYYFSVWNKWKWT